MINVRDVPEGRVAQTSAALEDSEVHRYWYENRVDKRPRTKDTEHNNAVMLRISWNVAPERAAVRGAWK